MEALLLLCLFPLAWPFFAKRIWDTEINYQEMALSMVIVTVVVIGVWQAGKWSQTLDTEVWNGYVTNKKIEDDHYQTSYCCGTDKDGNCTSTCYTDHYTRHWNGYTTVGKVTFNSIDTTSKSRRNSSPPPNRYKICKVGEPAAIEHRYTNYVQAVPTSLFNDTSNVAEQFAGKVPTYPRVHDFYRFNRVINVGQAASPAFVNQLDSSLDLALKTLGRQKQVNIIVILTKIQDKTYRYAVENAWLGGEKNDVIIFLGVDGNKIVWTDVMTWALNSGNELFHVTMRDGLAKLGTLDNPQLTPTITGTISKLYDRPQMADYEYLAKEVEPPTWVIILAIFLSIGGSLGMTFVFHKYEVDFLNNRGYNRRRRFKFK